MVDPVPGKAVGRAKGQAGEGVPALMRGWSLEATLPRPDEIAAIAEIVAPGTAIYLSSLPRVDHARQLAAATNVRAAGLEPVLHISARKFVSEAQLKDYLAAAQGEAGVVRCLIIAGDINVPRGPFASSLSLMQSAAFRSAGLKEVDIAGYPDGHPFLSQADLAQALKAKLAVARQDGVVPHIVTQFSFDAAAIVRWHAWLREIAPEVPVHIGLAGPANANTLLQFALRCSVNLPLRHANTAAKLLGGVSPDGIVAALAAGLPAAEAGSTRLALHFYSFGGLARTAAWARAAARGPSGEGPDPAEPSLLHRLRQISGYRSS